MGDTITALQRAIATASNDDTSTNGSEARDRHVQRLSAMLDAASEIASLTDRAESAEAVLRVTRAMMGADDWSKDDVWDYLESSMATIDDDSKERDQ